MSILVYCSLVGGGGEKKVILGTILVKIGFEGSIVGINENGGNATFGMPKRR